MKYLLVITAYFFSFPALAQQSVREYGNISTEEFEMQYYVADSTAPAVVLFDVGNSEFFEVDYGYDISFRRHRRIKVFNKAKFGTQEIIIPFYNSNDGRTEKVVQVEAHTLNMENGKLKKSYVLPGSVFEEKINDNWKIKKFVFPNVQDGSIIEFRYEIEIPFKANMPRWDFQSNIPTVHSEYTVSLIPFYEYVYYAQGIDQFDEMEKYNSSTARTWGKINKSYGQNVRNGFDFNDLTYRFVLKDVPAFKDESYISSVNNHIIRMYFQLAVLHHPRSGKKEILSTWPKLNETLMKHEKFGKYIRKASRISENSVEELNLDALSTNDKSKVIVKYVKDNFQWNGVNSKYASQSPKDLLKSRIGNSADLNLFMIGMLQEANVKCEPVILSTREHGLIRGDYPFDFYTNYVVALVGDQLSFLSDATNEFIPYNRIPPKCLNDKGLIVREEEETWISLDFDVPSIEKYVINLTPQPEIASVDYSVSLQTTEYEAHSYRESFENEDAEIKDHFKAQLSNISGSKSLFYEDLNRPYIIVFEGEKEINKIGPNLVINPFLDLPIQENKLIQSERSYPVDFVYRTNTEFETNLSIPKGYKIISMPENYSLNNDLVDINLTVNSSAESISIRGGYNFKKSVYQSEDYKNIQEYFNIIIEKFREEVVLIKI